MNHGERAKPSLLPSTAKARAPMQRRLLAPVVRAVVVCVDGEDPMRKGPHPPQSSPPLRHAAASTTGEEVRGVVSRKKNSMRPLVGP